mmetsp:Transcript_147365/g.473545  ORF Transcript_147365/g.473545 Transcript_147365/m.473545 type:complete len:202 (-) Transcript_147365:23-628(-)
MASMSGSATSSPPPCARATAAKRATARVPKWRYTRPALESLVLWPSSDMTSVKLLWWWSKRKHAGSQTAPTSTTTSHAASTAGSRLRTTTASSYSGSSFSSAHASTSSQWKVPSWVPISRGDAPGFPWRAPSGKALTTAVPDRAPTHWGVNGANARAGLQVPLLRGTRLPIRPHCWCTITVPATSKLVRNIAWMEREKTPG